MIAHEHGLSGGVVISDDLTRFDLNPRRASLATRILSLPEIR